MGGKKKESLHQLLHGKEKIEKRKKKKKGTKKKKKDASRSAVGTILFRARRRGSRELIEMGILKIARSKAST